MYYLPPGPSRQLPEGMGQASKSHHFASPPGDCLDSRDCGLHSGPKLKREHVRKMRHRQPIEPGALASNFLPKTLHNIVHEDLRIRRELA